MWNCSPSEYRDHHPMSNRATPFPHAPDARGEDR